MEPKQSLYPLALSQEWYQRDSRTLSPYHSPWSAARRIKHSREPRDKGTKITFAYCGGLSAHKGVHVLIAAFRSLENLNVKLRIYGTSGPHEPVYERMLRNTAGQDDRIKFCGRYPEEEVGEVFHTIDALIIPSLCYESYSFALHEALASRLPVIASAVPCLDEKIKDSGGGLTFRAGDADDLARNLRLIVSDPRVLDKIKENMKSGTVSRLEEEAYLYKRVTAKPEANEWIWKPTRKPWN